MTESRRMPAFPPADVDAIAAAALECAAVAGLHEGGDRAVATYLPGRRVVGVRVEDQRVLVSVVLASGSSVRMLESEMRSRVAPHVRGRQVDLHVADVQTGREHP